MDEVNSTQDGGSLPVLFVDVPRGMDKSRLNPYGFERLHAGIAEEISNVNIAQRTTIYQTTDWLAFLSDTQNGELVWAAVKESGKTIGLFAGLIVRKFGLRVLGSPFPGWSTDYMGLVLPPEVKRGPVLRALIDFAFRQLGCVHLEMMGRHITEEDLRGLDVQYKPYRSFEIDLGRQETELFGNMTSACRRCIRKAHKEGVLIEEAHDLQFADDYYGQLRDVFAKQWLVPPYGVERVRRLIRHLHPTGHLLLLRARDRGGRCIATGIFPHMNGVMYFWGGASWRQSQSLRPNEVLQWHAMQIGKRKGIRIYDMGGDGDYKRKYGGYEITVPWFRKSKYPWVRYAREMAERTHAVGRRCLGRYDRMVARRQVNHLYMESQS
jgi:CelD/BcsL family acetyltransferase involved in cellulose biosynthesis